MAIALAAIASPARGASPLELAGTLMASYHEDLSRIDRAREVLEQALATNESAEILAALARACLLQGELRARTPDERLAAYQRGRDAGKRAIELAPRSEEAHLAYVANLGRWAEARGVMQALSLVPQVRQEFELLLALSPKSPDVHVGVGSFLFELPGLLGGDRATAEQHFRQALELDVSTTNARVELARVLIATARFTEARGQLQHVLDEKSPADLARWTVRDAPRARELLRSIQGRGSP